MQKITVEQRIQEIELAIMHIGTILAGRNAMKMNADMFKAVLTDFAQLLNKFHRRLDEAEKEAKSLIIKPN